MPKSFAKSIRTAAQMAIAAVAIAASTLVSAEPLRVCSDPDNLPFSKADGLQRGLYIELAELVGKHLGMPVEYVWHLTFNQRRALRNTIAACDAYFALPASPDYKAAGVTRTRAFLDVGYVIAARPGLRMGSVKDLNGRRIGVTFGSSAQVVLSNLSEPIELRSYRDTQQIFAAIDAGEIDAGIVWGPHAGFLNLSEFNNRWQLTPVSGLGLSGQIAVAVPKGKEDLREKIDAALIELRPEIDQLQRKYGFPSGQPLAFDDKSSWRRLSARVARGLDGGDVSDTGRGLAVKRQLAADASEDFRRYLRKVNDDEIKEYRAVFNSRCSHCHSQNGASPQPERDLRRLSNRYADDWKNVARKTIHEGRPEYGMPAWGESLSSAEIENLITYLETIQRKK